MANQTAVDKAMFALDGTENKCKYIYGPVASVRSLIALSICVYIFYITNR